MLARFVLLSLLDDNNVVLTLPRSREIACYIGFLIQRARARQRAIRTSKAVPFRRVRRVVSGSRGAFSFGSSFFGWELVCYGLRFFLSARVYELLAI